MARTELPNGVILPAEYSDDWYEDMTSNLTKLDDVIGSDSEKLNADGVYFLRMSSAALTDSGTGNFSDLNSSYKIKTGDLVLDSGRKLYRIVSVDSANETFTVGNSLFKITAESDLAPVAESGDYDDLDNKPDLNPYDQHIVNTDIHVTTADKAKWNNGVTQAYVLRYSSTAITDNSTIAYSTLDNTDNIKVSDKIIDTDGKIFSIVSVDSDNSTVTIGSALVDLALDGNVVHTSGNETVGGVKTFNDLQIIGYGTQYKGSRDAYILPEFAAGYSGLSVTTLSFAQTVKIGTFVLDANNKPSLDASKGYIQFATGENNSVNTCVLEPRNSTSFLGTSANRWSKIYGTEYYYGSNNVEFSTKFVTTDTAQTISGNKTFSSINGLEPSSLSLPSGNLNDVIDISGYLVNLDGTVNTYTARGNGWIAITMSGCSGIQAYISGLWGDQVVRPSVGTVRFLMPVVTNLTVNILIFGGAIDNARFIPCQGNV